VVVKNLKAQILDKYPHSEWADKALEEAMQAYLPKKSLQIS